MDPGLPMVTVHGREIGVPADATVTSVTIGPAPGNGPLDMELRRARDGRQ
jgi:hypothetical protein